MSRIAILTSGGDAPGMNAAIRAATLLACARGWEVLGVRQGYRGLVRGDLVPLAPADVVNVVREGGTMLGSARCVAFRERPARDAARAYLRAAGVEAVVVIGGNGSLAGAWALGNPAEAGFSGPRVVGVPASIDNDIGGTTSAIGVDSAVNTIVEACDKITDTADAHDRTFLVEVMGRDCGYLAIASAIAAGADAVLYPEAGRSDDDVVDRVVRAVREVRGRSQRTRRVLVIKAEGVGIPVEQLKQRVDERLRDEPWADPEGAETRVTVLGHVVRGGRPSAFDRLLASRLAHVATAAALTGRTGLMASWIPPALPAPPAAERTEDPCCWLVGLDGATLDADRSWLGLEAAVVQAPACTSR